MSTLKTNNVQVGQSVTATNNFTLYQPSSPDGTVRLGVGNSGATTGDALTVSNVGTVTATTFSGSGASLTALNASNLGSGTVPTARLATGTATSTTFLRGDQTWASATPSTADVLTATAGASYGGVGTYASSEAATGVALGATTAGSNLQARNASGANVSAGFSGTWRNMGGSASNNYASLFLRIS
jgi:hypothetical protein